MGVNMKIYTSNFENYANYKGLSMARTEDKPKDYRGKTIRELVPKKSTLDDMSICPDPEHMQAYIKKYYESTIRHLDPGIVIMKLREESVLLGPEDPHDFSPRHIVAAWLELLYGQEIREVASTSDGKLNVLPRNKYFNTIKTALEILLKNDMDMHGYTSIAAAHAYEQAKKIADKEGLYENLGISEEMYMKLADALEQTYGRHDKSI